MSKAAKIKMAGILHGAGYNLGAILSAIGFPFCVSMRQIEPPSQSGTLTPLTVDGFQVGGELESLILPDTGLRIDWATKKTPNASYIKISGTHTIGFTYSDKTNVSLLVRGQMDIPNPPTWPRAKFLSSLNSG